MDIFQDANPKSNYLEQLNLNLYSLKTESKVIKGVKLAQKNFECQLKKTGLNKKTYKVTAVNSVWEKLGYFFA